MNELASIFVGAEAGAELGDLLVSDGAVAEPSDRAMERVEFQAETRRQVVKMLSLLTERERVAVTLRHGIGREDGMSWGEVQN